LAAFSIFIEGGLVKIKELFQSKKRVLSFELFPPKRDGDLEELFRTVEELKSLKPDYISITYGAGGSSREKTLGIAARLREMGVLPLMHFTCVGHSRGEIQRLLDEVKSLGIENILALRGDAPKGQGFFEPAPDGFRFASELIGFIRSKGYDFCLGVAGYPEVHPEAAGAEEDLQNLKGKLAAGGEFVVTQLFYNNQDYFNLVKKLRDAGVEAPVQPGVWLLTDYLQIEKTASFGAHVPPELMEGLKPFKDDKEKVTQAGIDYATRQCEELLQKGAPGIHFYVMNKSHSVRAVLANLKAKGLIFG
jgi:methylenetetrahydrofolate reductase (NADPH)